MKLALLIIDMQKAYYENEDKVSMDRAAEYINEAVSLFRRNNLPLVWIQDADEEDGIVPCTPGFEIINTLSPGEDEKRIHKNYGNSFNKTGLLDYLGSVQVDTVVLTGYCAEYCVLSTYRGARDLDLFPVLLRHGTASGTAENIRFVESISELVTLNVLRRMIEG